MTRAIMNGCNGKMGQCITGICAQDEDIEIVAGIDTYDGIKNDYPVFASLKECTVDADVIIDFPMQKQWMRCLHMVWKNRFRSCFVRQDFPNSSLPMWKSIRKSCNFKIRKYVSRNQYSDGTAQKSCAGICAGRI